MEKTILVFVIILTSFFTTAQNLNLAVISDSPHIYNARGDNARMIRSIPVGGIRNLEDNGKRIYTEIHGLIISKDSTGKEVGRTYKPLNHLQVNSKRDYDKNTVDYMFKMIATQLNLSITKDDSYTDIDKIIFLSLLINETETALDSEGNPTGLFGGDNFEIYKAPNHEN